MPPSLKDLIAQANSKSIKPVADKKENKEQLPTPKQKQIASQLAIIKSNQDVTAKQDDGSHGETVLDQFKNLMTVLDQKLKQENLDKTEISDLVRNLMSRANSNPSIAMALQPEDIGLLVRGARQSYATCVATKSASQKKRAEKANQLEETRAIFADINL